MNALFPNIVPIKDVLPDVLAYLDNRSIVAHARQTAPPQEEKKVDPESK